MDLLKQKKRFASDAFKEEYHCDLPLGAFCSADGTLFRLWAPTADEVTLCLYQEGHTGHAMRSVPMTSEGRGAWIYRTDENLDGIYYEYLVTVEGEQRRSADPYAVACGLNGQRSMVLDLSRTDPDGWDRDQAPGETPEQIIYELHVKDFSWDPAGGFAEKDRGRYSALCRTDDPESGLGTPHGSGLPQAAWSDPYPAAAHL